MLVLYNSVYKHFTNQRIGSHKRCPCSANEAFRSALCIMSTHFAQTLCNPDNNTCQESSISKRQSRITAIAILNAVTDANLVNTNQQQDFSTQFFLQETRTAEQRICKLFSQTLNFLFEISPKGENSGFQTRKKLTKE